MLLYFLSIPEDVEIIIVPWHGHGIAWWIEIFKVITVMSGAAAAMCCDELRTGGCRRLEPPRPLATRPFCNPPRVYCTLVSPCCDGIVFQPG